AAGLAGLAGKGRDGVCRLRARDAHPDGEDQDCQPSRRESPEIESTEASCLVHRLQLRISAKSFDHESSTRGDKLLASVARAGAINMDPNQLWWIFSGPVV